MEYFVFGLIIGYFLFPLAEVFGDRVRRIIDRDSTLPGCSGNCNQGRRACDCQLTKG